MKYLIFGITGQDGGYLASSLLKNGHAVIGVRRPASTDNTKRLMEIMDYENASLNNLEIEHGDLSDPGSINDVISKHKADAVINFAAQSHVGVSFNLPELTANVDALGTLRILEAIRKYSIDSRFYQASTSELYGGIYNSAVNEDTPFNPKSPYAVAKLYSFWITKHYRDAYKIHASNGILFNHESPFRGEHFVTQKIIKALVGIKQGTYRTLRLGNLESKRDWGHAKDYVRAVEKMINADSADDYVVATGKTYSIRDFIHLVLKKLEIKGNWQQNKNGMDEFKCDESESNNERINKIIIKQDKKYFRPSDVEYLLGDPSKINSKLGWQCEIHLEALVDEMINFEMRL